MSPGLPREVASQISSFNCFSRTAGFGQRELTVRDSMPSFRCRSSDLILRRVFGVSGFGMCLVIEL